MYKPVVLLSCLVLFSCSTEREVEINNKHWSCFENICDISFTLNNNSENARHLNIKVTGISADFKRPPNTIHAYTSFSRIEEIELNPYEQKVFKRTYNVPDTIGTFQVEIIDK